MPRRITNAEYKILVRVIDYDFIGRNENGDLVATGGDIYKIDREAGLPFYFKEFWTGDKVFNITKKLKPKEDVFSWLAWENSSLLGIGGYIAEYWWDKEDEYNRLKERLRSKCHRE